MDGRRCTVLAPRYFRVMAGGLHSAELILDRVASEHQSQLGHFEALDGKAGLQLGFSGVLIALTRDVAAGPRLLNMKAGGLKVGFVLLVGAVVTLGVGVIVDHV